MELSTRILTPEPWQSLGVARARLTLRINAALRVRKNLRLVPASFQLANGDVGLSQLAGSDVRLRRAMGTCDWDIALIDCPPSLGKLTMNALVGATHVLVPIDSGPYALEG